MSIGIARIIVNLNKNLVILTIKGALVLTWRAVTFQSPPISISQISFVTSGTALPLTKHH